MNRKPLHVIALIAGLALVLAATALADRVVVRTGNLYLVGDGGISPSNLPRHGDAPIAARLIGEVGTVDGSHPPALRSIDFKVDRTIGVDAVGLPTCKATRIEATSTADAKGACRSAIVGSGMAEVEVAFPEQAPFSATGPVVLFNGGVRGRTTVVLVHAYVDVPAPTAIVTRATVTRIHSGRFGMRIAAKIPKIAGGAGSVTKFDLKVSRRFTHEGVRKSFLVASCPNGRWMTKGHVQFDDGTELGVNHVFPCTARG
jgi:hypothetical protein